MSNKKTYHIFSNSTQEIMEYLIKKLESRKRNLSNYIHIFDSIDSIEIFYQKKNEISLLFKNLEEELHQSALAIKALMIQNKALSHESIEASSIQSKYNKLLKENNFLLLENNFYERKFNHFNQSNVEININFKPKVAELDEFISKYNQKRINLIFENLESFNQEWDPDLILEFRKKYPNCDLVIRLPEYNPRIQTLLTQKQVPHYYYIFANKWEIFNGLLETSVTDIYVTEDLCFSMDIIQQKAQAKNKKIRVFCDVCQTSWPYENSLRTFFIRPEDINLYNKYIDVVEFFNAEYDKD